MESSAWANVLLWDELNLFQKPWGKKKKIMIVEYKSKTEFDTIPWRKKLKHNHNCA